MHYYDTPRREVKICERPFNVTNRQRNQKTEHLW